jgi:hypothetical protein
MSGHHLAAPVLRRFVEELLAEAGRPRGFGAATIHPALAAHSADSSETTSVGPGALRSAVDQNTTGYRSTVRSRRLQRAIFLFFFFFFFYLFYIFFF